MQDNCMTALTQLPILTRTKTIPCKLLQNCLEKVYFQVPDTGTRVHSQIHDFEVEHVVRPACGLTVSLQSTYKPFTSIGTFR